MILKLASLIRLWNVMHKPYSYAPWDLTVISIIYLGLERYEDCLDDCERALELKADYVKAYTHMGWALFYLKDRMDEDSQGIERV
jgi:hypothetical protein